MLFRERETKASPAIAKLNYFVIFIKDRDKSENNKFLDKKYTANSVKGGNKYLINKFPNKNTRQLLRKEGQTCYQ